MKLAPEKIRKLDDFAAHYTQLRLELDTVNKDLEFALGRRDALSKEIDTLRGVLDLLKDDVKAANIEFLRETRHTDERKKELKRAEERCSKQIDSEKRRWDSEIKRLSAEQARLSESILKYRHSIEELHESEADARASILVLEGQYKELCDRISEKRGALEFAEKEIRDARGIRALAELERDAILATIKTLEAEANRRSAEMREAVDSLREKLEALEVREKNLLIREGRYKSAMKKYFPNVQV